MARLREWGTAIVPRCPDTAHVAHAPGCRAACRKPGAAQPRRSARAFWQIDADRLTP